MKISIIVLLATVNLLALTASAQKTKTVTKTTTKVSPANQKANAGKTATATASKSAAPSLPLTKAETMPKFPGGGQALEAYFVKALAEFKIYQPAGVALNIVIDPAGKVTKAIIKNGYRKYENGLWLEYPEIDKALTDAALTMPAWEPGQDKGKPVSVQQDLYLTVMTPEQARENEEKTFTFVEQPPQFPGGEQKMMEFIGANLKYPADAQANKQEGLVIVQFVINRFGDISEATILRSFAESASQETLRLIRSMPQWVPGRQNGRPVAVRFTLPVRFQL